MYSDEDYRAIDAYVGFLKGCAIRPPLRMDTTCTPGGTGRVSPFGCDVVYGDLLPSPSSEDPEAVALRSGLRAAVAKALATLKPRERRVLCLRFGFDGEPQTLEQIGAVFGVTRERIRQVEAKALKKLQAPHVIRVLEPWAAGRPAHGRPSAAAVVPQSSPASSCVEAGSAPRPAQAPPAASSGTPASPGPAPGPRLPSSAEDALFDAIWQVFFGDDSGADPDSGSDAEEPPADDAAVDPRERLLAMLEPNERAALEHLYGIRAAMSLAAIERQVGIPRARVTELDRWFTRELRRLRAAPGTYDPAPPPPPAPAVPGEPPGHGGTGGRLLPFPAASAQDPLTAALDRFRARGYEVVDNRPRGGALWVHDLHMHLARKMEDLSRRGIRFRFTEHKSAGTWGWYLERTPPRETRLPPGRLALPSPRLKPRKARGYRVQP